MLCWGIPATLDGGKTKTESLGKKYGNENRSKNRIGILIAYLSKIVNDVVE
jgi:hypothetical protein